MRSLSNSLLLVLQMFNFRLMEKADGRPLDLVVMDGSIKKMGYSFMEEGAMFKVLLL